MANEGEEDHCRYCLEGDASNFEEYLTDPRKMFDEHTDKTEEALRLGEPEFTVSTAPNVSAMK